LRTVIAAPRTFTADYYNSVKIHEIKFTAPYWTKVQYTAWQIAVRHLIGDSLEKLIENQIVPIIAVRDR